MAGGSAPGASLVDRTLDVLGAFDERHRRLTLTQLAARSDLTPPTTLRIVRRLLAAGALERTDDGSYVVGRRLWDIGLLAPVQTGLREVAAPFLQDLHAATRATVHLAERDGHRVLYLDRLSGVASVPVVSRVGSRLPMHATGVGKVLLAHAPADVQQRVLADLRKADAVHDRHAGHPGPPARAGPTRRFRDHPGGADAGRLLRRGAGARRRR